MVVEYNHLVNHPNWLYWKTHDFLNVQIHQVHILAWEKNKNLVYRKKLQTINLTINTIFVGKAYDTDLLTGIDI